MSDGKSINFGNYILDDPAIVIYNLRKEIEP